MNKLSKKEGIAVFAGIAVLTYLLFSNSLVNLFSNSTIGQEVTNNTTTMIETGFTAQDVLVGSGEIARAGDTVSAHYVGQLTNGKVFDSSLDRGVPITFTLGVGQVIRGWDEGIVGMRAGGKRILTIAPDFAYGDQAVGAIPSNSVLIFEIELVAVEKTQAE